MSGEQQTVEQGAVEEMTPEQYTTQMRGMSDAEVMADLADNRDHTVPLIFERMAQYFRPEAAEGIDAVIDWKILRADGPADCYQAVIRQQTCTLSPDGDQTPEATLIFEPLNFVRVVTGTLPAQDAFVYGLVTVEGSLPLASRVPQLFDIPAGGEEQS